MEEDDRIRDLLERVKTIAVVGIKNDPAEDAYRVPAYLKARGYRIVPVNPKVDTVFGERAFDSISQIEEPVDLIDLFRASPHVPAHVDEILALSPPPLAVWMQLGIREPASAARLEARGIAVVQDRCLMVDHRRLLG